MSQVSPQAPGYLVKYVVDSIVTDGATSSGPHGISLSTTMDDDVFMEVTLREVEEKTPDSQDEVSERSVLKVSPGAVRQEVSQAISDKKGTLIILKEDKLDTECSEMSVLGEKEDPVVPGETDAEDKDLLSSSNEKEMIREDNAVVIEAQMTVVKTLSPKIDVKTDDMTQNKGIDSPKKAMASWISEEVKTEASEVMSVSAEEFKMTTCDFLQHKDEIFIFEGVVQTEQPKSSFTQNSISESSTTTLAGVLYEKSKATTWFWLRPSIPPPPPPAAYPHCLPSGSSQTSLTTV